MDMEQRTYEELTTPRHSFSVQSSGIMWPRIRMHTAACNPEEFPGASREWLWKTLLSKGHRLAFENGLFAMLEIYRVCVPCEYLEGSDKLQSL